VAIWSAKAIEPAVVCILSAVSILSLIKMGIPCKGPRSLPCLRSLSICSASNKASGFTSITDFKSYLPWSISLIRVRYNSASLTELYLPDCNPCCNSAMVISESSNSSLPISAAAIPALSRFFSSELLEPLLHPVITEAAVPATVTAAAAANDPLRKNFLLFIIQSFR